MEDRAVNEEEAAALVDYIRKGLRVLAMGVGKTPRAVVQAVDDFVRTHAAKEIGGFADIEDEFDLALSIGAVWGELLVRSRGWRWVLVEDDEEEGRFGVVTPTRSLALYPLHFKPACKILGSTSRAC